MPGASPKETKSAKESRSLPMGELMPIFLATNPSKKSNIMAMTSNNELHSMRPENARIMAKIPQRKLMEVIKFGRLNNFKPFSFI
jgi:hypothetical protein